MSAPIFFQIITIGIQLIAVLFKIDHVSHIITTYFPTFSKKTYDFWISQWIILFSDNVNMPQKSLFCNIGVATPRLNIVNFRLSCE